MNQKEVIIWLKETLQKIMKANLIPPVSIKLIWAEKPCPDDKDIEASIQYFRKKKTAKLTIFPIFKKYFKEGKKNYLQEVLIHELSHLLTAELEELALDPESTPQEIEKATERLSCVIGKYLKKILENKSTMEKIHFYDFEE